MLREDVEFKGEAGVTLRGWFYPAEGVIRDSGQAPTIVLAHGLSAVKEMHLDDYAAYFAKTGLNALVYDHRNFGDSDGAPRLEADPVMQYRDMRNAITYAITRSDVDPAKIGLWGTSFAGGHVLMVAAIDRRVRAVVSQVPGVSGSSMLGRMIRPDFVPFVRAQMDADRVQRFSGGEPIMLPVVSADPMGQAVMPSPDAYHWFTTTADSQAPNWKNEVTSRTMEMVTEYEPGSYIARIAPTPLLMIVAEEDAVAPVELALAAYAEAREPKAIRVIPGGHFDAYTGAGFEASAQAACDHFHQHLSA